MHPIFTPVIEAWYRKNGRDLPWRETRNAYRIWISEIILQQTRVSQGYDYYLRFLHRFPDVEKLASASEDEVLRLWQGLGYYSRARNLHAAAKQIVERGGFPKSFDEIKQLRGVGDYTAAAIASMAYDLPHAVVDGNVYRVLSRYLGIDTPIDTTVGQKLFRTLAYDMLDKRQPALYNQAIMDFGAMLCNPTSPKCIQCPLAETCVAMKEGSQDKLPVKSHQTKVRDRYFTYLFVQDKEGRMLIQRRPAGDIWQGLYELPLIETPNALPSADEMAEKYPEITPLVGEIRHLLSHQRLHAQCYSVPVDSCPETSHNQLWVLPSELEDYGMPKLIVTILQQILG